MKRLLALALVALVASCGASPPTELDRLRVVDEHYAGYDRDEFGSGWLDLDRDGEDTRDEILANTLERYGYYYSRYDNELWMRASDVDIDHTVALAEAWQSGAWKWSDRKRERFANDPANLVVMTDNLNQSKGSDDIAEWQPDYDECHYLDVWVEVKTRYKLSVDLAERRALRDLDRICAPYRPTLRAQGGDDGKGKDQVLSAKPESDESRSKKPEPKETGDAPSPTKSADLPIVVLSPNPTSQPEPTATPSPEPTDTPATITTEPSGGDDGSVAPAAITASAGLGALIGIALAVWRGIHVRRRNRAEDASYPDFFDET